MRLLQLLHHHQLRVAHLVRNIHERKEEMDVRFLLPRELERRVPVPKVELVWDGVPVRVREETAVKQVRLEEGGEGTGVHRWGGEGDRTQGGRWTEKDRGWRARMKGAEARGGRFNVSSHCALEGRGKRPSKGRFERHSRSQAER